MADLAQIEAAFMRAHQAGDSKAAGVLAAEVRRMRAAPSAAPAVVPEPTGMDSATRDILLASKPLDRGGEVQRSVIGSAMHQAGNIAAGGFRGAGSIGATLMYPLDKARDMIDGADKLKLSNLITGNKPKTRNEQRRADMDNAFADMGTDTDSLSYKAGKLAGEVAGTAGAGGLVARGAAAVPGLASAAPNLINAVRTSGMVAGPTGGAAGALTRAAGGAAAGGASAAMVNPSDAGTGAAVGSVLPGALNLIGRGAKAVGGAARGVIEPFTESGRTAIAGRTLERFGVHPSDVVGLSSMPSATGARTTLAEQIRRPEGAAGAARLQDAVRSLDPEIAAKMTAREVENNSARVSKLRELAGEGGARDFALAERAGTSGPMYDAAFKVAADGRKLTAEQSRTMLALQRAPAIKAASIAARENASNAGSNVGKANVSGSVEGLHNVKLALDAQITQARNPANPAGQATLDGLQAAQKRLVSFIESISPEYANARGVHALMSKPINQMDIAGEVLRRGSSATSDLAGNPRLMPDSMLRALRDEPRLIKQATGRDLGGSLDKVLDKEQLNALRSVADEVDRAAAVARAGNGPGSGTAQRLASTNLLQQIGVPSALADNAFVQTLMRPVQFGANIAEPRIQQALLNLIQNPALAAQAMQKATPVQRVALQKLISAAARPTPLTAGDR